MGSGASLDQATRCALVRIRSVALTASTRVLRLTLPAPNIVEAILDGTQGLEVTPAMVLEPFPIEWAEQQVQFCC